MSEILTTSSKPWQLLSITEPCDEWTRQADTIHAITEQESILNMAIVYNTGDDKIQPIDWHLKDVDLRDWNNFAHVTIGSSSLCSLQTEFPGDPTLTWFLLPFVALLSNHSILYNTANFPRVCFNSWKSGFRKSLTQQPWIEDDVY